MTTTRTYAVHRLAAIVVTACSAAGCGWHGVNSLPLPGTAGRGPGSYEITAQLPDVSTIEQNSRVRVGDVTVGNVEAIRRQGWHAMVTMRIDGDVRLPGNATATVGQTSLLGSTHIELAAPQSVPPAGTLTNGALIPLSSAGSYPTTEQTLAAVSLLLNGGGLGQVQDITKAFSTAFAGRENDLRSLIEQLDLFTAHVENQTGDILTATASLNALADKFVGNKSVLDEALRTIPTALAVVRDERDNLVEALDLLGKFSALATDTVDQTKEKLVQELRDIAPVLESLANSGPALTKSLDILTTYPWPRDTLKNWFRGDYANISMVVDLTLSRLDSSFFTGTRFEGNLTELEMQWGRTIGQMPSPYTAGNPLIIPYRLDQGP